MGKKREGEEKILEREETTGRRHEGKKRWGEKRWRREETGMRRDNG